MLFLSSKYNLGDAPVTLVDKWAYFFREAKNLNVIPSSLAEEPFREALEGSRTAQFSVDDWNAYDRAKMAEQDARGALAIERHEGKREGIAEGKLQGQRSALQAVLSHMGVVLTEDEQRRIAECTDGPLLERWLRNALSTATPTAAIIFA